MIACEVLDQVIALDDKGDTLAHKGPNLFKCNECNHTASEKGNLNKHIKRVHAGEKSFFLQRM